jgi:hypothetical protein
MTTARMTQREALYGRVRGLSEGQAAEVMEFINCFEEHEPNEETAKALRDSENGIGVSGPFHNMNDFIVSLLTEDNA